MFRKSFLWCALVLAGLLLGSQAQAVSLQYQASDLPDLVAGRDRWSYDYQLSGSFGDFEGINLIYRDASYADLTLTAAPAGPWSNLTVQPDPGFADGLLGLTAIVAQNPFKLPFTLEFTWLGTGQPGAQDFEVFDSGFSLIGSGRTTLPAAAGVPEPATLLLLAGALGLLHRRQRRRG